ncbi:MAG: hypothetical protein IJ565_05840 [Bacilli bacterium]|nr:hypothetical protein [Bacilli bacterium]
MKYIKSKSIKYIKIEWDYEYIIIPGKYIYSYRYIPFGVKYQIYGNGFEMKYLYIELDLDYLKKNYSNFNNLMIDTLNGEEGIWSIDLVFRTDAESNFIPPYVPRKDFKNPLQKSRVEGNKYIIEWR